MVTPTPPDLPPAPSPRWGIVTTVKAPPARIAEFCAYHLRAGAAHITLCLDDPNGDVPAPVAAHPRITLQRCDAQHWRDLTGKRPEKHQQRQTLNATWAYRQSGRRLDWIAHIDVDEFITAPAPIADMLGTVAAEQFCLRLRPMEPLAGAPGLFKSSVPRGPDRDRILQDLYPDWADLLQGGLLSHTAGKLFVRTGARNIRLRIHNVFQGQVRNPAMTEIAQMRLAHMHAPNCDAFLHAYRFRLTRGSYRAELAPNRPREQGGVTLHELLSQIEIDSGEDGLRQFYDQVCTAHPALLEELERHGLLHRADLQLEEAVTAIFSSKI
ncbi:glycosyltransferase family 2 protein [Aliishimia ponticola]|uniref:Glycosyltransferase family 2 protein n=1 Tax=Aliishimia ponticola TaxID=2499833 RepID=A0A4S4NRW4_9RHOB|nr:glycosyltransferase family 2 protein [Aliishimia ponticola]THH38970.1 glycosyltransferase family 2 protein [Aliishimia ponticola]